MIKVESTVEKSYQAYQTKRSEEIRVRSIPFQPLNFAQGGRQYILALTTIIML